MLTIMIKIAIISITDRRKTRRLEKISRRLSDENLLNLFENIRFGNDNLIVFVKLIMRLYRFHRSFAVEPRDYIVGRNDVYSERFLPIIIPVKIPILISQIFMQRLISISDCRSLISLILMRLSYTPFIFCIFD
jgi:hypothetical protein